MSFKSTDQVGLLRHLVTYVIRHRPFVLVTTLIGVLSSGIEVVAIASLIPISLLATGQPIRTTSPWHELPLALGFQPNVKFYATTFIVLLLIRTLSSGLNMMLVARTFRHMIAHFSSRALDSFMAHLSFEKIQKQSVGHFIALTGDESNRAAQIIMYLMRIVPIFTLLTFYLGTLIYQSWILGAILVAFFALTLVCLRQAFRISVRLGGLQQEQARVTSTHLLESLNGLRTVRGFNGEFFVSSQYKKMMHDYVWTCLKIDYVNLASRTLPAALLLAVLLVITTNFIDIGWFTRNLSFIFVALMMVLRVLPLAGQLLDFGMRLLSDLRAAENIGTMLAAVEASETRALLDPATLPPVIRSIEFDNVCFRYSPDTPPVLRHFCQTFQAGKSYAIVGPSGIGKSSMIDLLLKFYEPDAGTIRINAADAADLPSAWIRGHVVLAEQTTRLFYDTVLHNVTFGRKASRETVGEALKLVGLKDFLDTLPDGVDTLVAYQGGNFSGGQRQRVGLARALLHPSDVLVIDEGTSALDHATKIVVLDRILDRYKDKLVIFVSHDQAVVDRVDEVIRLSALSDDALLHDDAAATAVQT
jgi:ABC-type bacteriocin/lantibiotic exporter with double-glycine peptidase domain